MEIICNPPFEGGGVGGHFAGMPMVADGRGVGVKNLENLPTSLMDGPFVFRTPETFMETDLDCGADPFRVAMCRGPLMFIEKVNLFLLLSRSAHTEKQYELKSLNFNTKNLFAFFRR